MRGSSVSGRPTPPCRSSYLLSCGLDITSDGVSRPNFQLLLNGFYLPSVL